MKKKLSKVIRVDFDFAKDLNEIAKVRLNKGLAKFNPKALSTVEMTKLLRRTSGYPLSMDDLKTKPRKEDLQ